MREGGKGEDEGEGGISLLHFAYCKKTRGKKDFTSFTKFIWLHRFGHGLVN